MIPVGATSVAIAYAIWAGRDRRPASVHRTVASYENFRKAMERRRRVR
jgi:hypothetical protein